MSVADHFKARLNAIAPQPFRIIGAAIDYASIDHMPNALPAAYVLVEEEASEPTDRATGKILQRCEADVAVIIIAGNLADTSGAAAAADLEPLKLAVRNAVIGTVPDAYTGEPVEHVGAVLLKAKSGVVWHKELFAAAHYIEEQ